MGHRRYVGQKAMFVGDCLFDFMVLMLAFTLRLIFFQKQSCRHTTNSQIPINLTSLHCTQMSQSKPYGITPATHQAGSRKHMYFHIYVFHMWHRNGTVIYERHKQMILRHSPRLWEEVTETRTLLLLAGWCEGNLAQNMTCGYWSLVTARAHTFIMHRFDKDTSPLWMPRNESI